MDSSLYRRISGLILLQCFLALKLYAGGSGLNTVVVINQTSSNSCILGNYYCRQRQVPPQNVLYINWSGANTLWTSADLQTTLVTPLLDMLAAQGLTSQIQYLVLSMDIPFQTLVGSTVDSTTSALFYGLRLGNGADPLGTTNSYAAGETAFNPAAIAGAPGYSFLTTMITADSLAAAEQLVDQGVAADGTFPQPPVVLAKSSDALRNLRYVFFDNAIFNANVLGVSTIMRTNTDSVSWPGTCAGYETGLANYSVPAAQFVPGSIADSLTSFGGVIFGDSGQTSLFAFTSAGAAGSYGTVAEPENDTQKFPNPDVYFYQARGFNIAESYYQSVNIPYLGLTVAEPLSAPFARSALGQWGTNLVSALFSGATNLSLRFTAHNNNDPLQQIDLFVDGTYYSTLTNIAPSAGNTLTVTLNGYPVTYTVPTNATLNTVAAGLGALINTVTNTTAVEAQAYGDRIQLQSIATNSVAAPFFVNTGVPTNTPGVSYGVNYLTDSSPPQMTPAAPDKSGNYTMNVGIPSILPYVILASTNLFDWQPIATNDVPGLFNFTDFGSTNYPERFYRMAWPSPNQPPQLSEPKTVAGTFQVHVSDMSGQAWGIQMSTDLVNWLPVFTNQLGGGMEYLDTNAANASARFYRAFLTTPAPPPFAVISPATNLTLVQVSGAVLPYTVGVSNQQQWTTLATNFAIGQIQTSAASAAGTGTNLTTFLNAAQPSLMPSSAFGYNGYMVISNVPPAGAELYFAFTLTNGQTVTVSAVNPSGGNSIALAGQLFNAINTNAALQGSDGVVAADYQVLANSAAFNVYARSPGYPAAHIQVRAVGYEVLMTGVSGPLTQNLSDLQPRNHLYVTAGASTLALTFPLATTNLSDGYHTLTAVAYEGSNVRTETQVSLPVQIQNSPLSATMTLLDLTNGAPSENTYHIQVTSNTNNVSLITLYSTGGALAAATNVSTAIFPVEGTNLWDGLHPFYAIVQTSSGLKYRTATQSITLGTP